MKHRQIIQMVGASGQSGPVIAQAYALCDDGTVWVLVLDTVFTRRRWEQLDVTEVETAKVDGR